MIVEKSRHSVYCNNYHFVQCIKYRKKILCNRLVCEGLKKKTASLIKKYQGRLVEIGLDKDHVHFLFSLKPETSLIKFINHWKSYTSKYLRNEYPWIKNQLRNCLWSRSYFIKTIGNPDFEKMKKRRSIGKKEGESRICYKFRLYPTIKQVKKLNFTRWQCKEMYNYLLEELRKPYKQKVEPIIPSYQELILCLESQYPKNDSIENHILIKEILSEYYKLVKIPKRGYVQSQVKTCRDSNPEMGEVLYSVLQYQNWKLWGNLKGLSSLKKKGAKVGILKPKKFYEFNTFTYANPDSFKILDGRLKLNRIGNIKMKTHRKINGNLKQVTITEKNRKWYASIITDYKMERKGKNRWVGIDLGIKSFLYDSNKNKISKPNILKSYLKQLKKENQDLSRRKLYSNNWRKQKDKLSKLHNKILEIRKDTLHKLSDDYVKKYKYIVVEKLNIKEMLEKKDKCGNRKPRKVDNKNISDAAWNLFIQLLEYKCKQANGKLIKVNPKNTTQTCSRCGNVKEGDNKLTLRDRIYKCNQCGKEIDRDYNAAKNILKKGKEIFKNDKK